MTIVLAACRSRPDAPADAAPPATDGVCAGGERDVSAVLAPLRAAHDARAMEVEDLLIGSTKQNFDGGSQIVEVVRSYPTCRAASEGILGDRVERALDAFFTKKELLGHREKRAMVLVRTGCEEAGELLLSLVIGLGVGENVGASYAVDEKKAKPLVDGVALAHADLDGDGKRDLVYGALDGRIAVRFARGGKTSPTPLKISAAEDTEMFYVGVPAVDNAFVLLEAYRGGNGSSEIKKRLRWDGKAFVVVERVSDDFETKYEAARSRELAVLDDTMFGGFGKLRGDLDRCGSVSPIDEACKSVFESAVAAMTKGGVEDTEARTKLRAYLGWHSCR